MSKNSFLDLLNKAIKPDSKGQKKSAPQSSADYTEKQTRSDKTEGASEK